MSITKLKDHLIKKELRFTNQGMYKALRALRKDDIVFMHKSLVTLNLRWLQHMETFTSLALHAHTDPRSGAGSFLELQDGDRIVYFFKNAVQMDAFWNHVLYILFKAIPKLDRWFTYSSHHWFLLSRREEELELMSYMKNHGIRCLFISAHKTPLDRAVTKDFDGDSAQYTMLDVPLFPKRRNNLGIVLNVLGDYVIEAQYDRRTTQLIEAFYDTHVSVEPDTIRDLEEAVTRKAKIKFVIMKDSRRAKKLSRAFEKYFYVGKGAIIKKVTN